MRAGPCGQVGELGFIPLTAVVSRCRAARAAAHVLLDRAERGGARGRDALVPSNLGSLALVLRMATAAASGSRESAAARQPGRRAPHEREREAPGSAGGEVSPAEERSVREPCTAPGWWQFGRLRTVAAAWLGDGDREALVFREDPAAALEACVQAGLEPRVVVDALLWELCGAQRGPSLRPHGTVPCGLSGEGGAAGSWEGGGDGDGRGAQAQAHITRALNQLALSRSDGGALPAAALQRVGALALLGPRRLLAALLPALGVKQGAPRAAAAAIAAFPALYRLRPPQPRARAATAGVILQLVLAMAHRACRPLDSCAQNCFMWLVGGCR